MGKHTINVFNDQPFQLVFNSQKEALAEWDALIEHGIKNDKLTLTNENGKEIATAIASGRGRSCQS